MNYSCLLHEEIEKGSTLGRVAQRLQISKEDAQRYLDAYKNEFEKYNNFTLEELKRFRKKLTIFKARFNVELESYKKKKQEEKATRDLEIKEESKAFNMPISKEELKEFKAIARLVANDEYLPVGYRKAKKPEPIVSNPKRYGFILPDDSKYEKCCKIQWTENIINDLKENFATKPTSYFCDKYGIQKNSMLEKAKKLGLKRTPETLKMIRSEARKRISKE